MPIGLEQYLIHPDHWNDDTSWQDFVPATLQDELHAANGPPIGLGRHPDKGWFVLGAGQGPTTLWSQWGHTGDPYG